MLLTLFRRNYMFKPEKNSYSNINNPYKSEPLSNPALKQNFLPNYIDVFVLEVLSFNLWLSSHDMHTKCIRS